MRKGSYEFTSESVTEGHPDKVCDQISDAVLDNILEQDLEARVACETLAGNGFVVVTGEITTRAYVDIQAIVRGTLKSIGYDSPNLGFDYNTVGILTSINKQSPDIAQGVNEDPEKGKEMGAGDQGMVTGYACNDTAELMPLPISMAHRLSIRLAKMRKFGVLPYLRPDGKTQVTVRYKDGKPIGLSRVVIAAQHDPDVDLNTLREGIIRQVIKPVVHEYICMDIQYFINNTGRFVIGGPVADSGCTGRKIISDTYGGVGNHGGGAFSGKDPTKVDRTAAYMARHIAKNIVKAEIADACEIQLAYVIGHSKPISLMIDTFGTGRIDNGDLIDLIKNIFPLNPGKMIDYLDLKKPIYRKTSVYGHFGREEPEFTWEKTDKAELLRKEIGI